MIISAIEKIFWKQKKLGCVIIKKIWILSVFSIRNMDNTPFKFYKTEQNGQTQDIEFSYQGK